MKKDHQHEREQAENDEDTSSIRQHVPSFLYSKLFDP